MYTGDIGIDGMLENIGKNPEACVVVDVRTAGEWVETGVCNVQCDVYQNTVIMKPENGVSPTFASDLLSRVAMDKTIYFICRSGVRSKTAGIIATQHGYITCYNVSEGMVGWLARGLPTESIHVGGMYGKD